MRLYVTEIGIIMQHIFHPCTFMSKMMLFTPQLALKRYSPSNPLPTEGIYSKLSWYSCQHLQAYCPYCQPHKRRVFTTGNVSAPAIAGLQTALIFKQVLTLCMGVGKMCMFSWLPPLEWVSHYHLETWILTDKYNILVLHTCLSNLRWYLFLCCFSV